MNASDILIELPPALLKAKPIRRLENVALGGRRVDIIIGEDGFIQAITSRGPAEPTALLPRVMPGVVNLHVHSRQPGGGHKEDWAHLWRALAKGGVTTVAIMPNTNPSITTRAALFEARRLAEHSPIQPFYWFGATPTNLEEIRYALNWPDVVGVKIYYGSSTGNLLVNDEKIVREIMQVCAGYRKPVALHAEDEALIQRNRQQLNRSPRLEDHSKIRSIEVEVSAVRKLCELAQATLCPIYFCHITSGEAMHVIARLKMLAQRPDAQAAGFKVWAEVCPHHVLLDDSLLSRADGARFKVNPSLKPQPVVQQLFEMYQAGLADTGCDDHAPHTLAEKAASDYDQIPSGMPGVETTLPLLLDLVARGRISRDLLEALLCRGPADVLGQPILGRVAVGQPADLVVYDPSAECTIRDQDIMSKCGWTPYHGWVVRGRVLKTLKAGRLIYDATAPDPFAPTVL